MSTENNRGSSEAGDNSAAVRQDVRSLVGRIESADGLPVTVTVAKLDKQGCLEGIEEVLTVVAVTDKRVLVPANIDLPMTGTYRWHEDRKTFIPLGYDAKKAGPRSPVDRDHALYSLIKMAQNSGVLDPGPDARAWADWWEQAELPKALERQVFIKRNSARR